MSWKYFTKEEFVCNPEKCGCGQNWINETFIDWLDLIRDNAGVPFVINSGFRCPDYNNKVSKTGRDGPHTTGWAADIRTPNSITRYAVRKAAMDLGCTRFGSAKGFIHVDLCDDLDPDKFPKEVEWVYR